MPRMEPEPASGHWRRVQDAKQRDRAIQEEVEEDRARGGRWWTDWICGCREGNVREDQVRYADPSRTQKFSDRYILRPDELIHSNEEKRFKRLRGTNKPTIRFVLYILYPLSDFNTPPCVLDTYTDFDMDVLDWKLDSRLCI